MPLYPSDNDFGVVVVHVGTASSCAIVSFPESSAEGLSVCTEKMLFRAVGCTLAKRLLSALPPSLRQMMT